MYLQRKGAGPSRLRMRGSRIVDAIRHGEWHKQTKKGERIMGILAWILVGLVAGLIARLLVPDEGLGNGLVGIVVTVLLGIAGALLGGFLAVAMGLSNGVDDFDIGTIFLAVVGSVLILIAYKAFAKGALSRT